MKQTSTLLLIVLISVFGKAQTVISPNEFLINPYAVSPSNSGLTGNHEIFVGGFYHLAGIQGAPAGVGVNYNGVIKKNSGIGAKLGFERYGAFRHITIDLSYAYHLRFASIHKVSIGLAVNLAQNSLDFSNSNSDPLNDPSIANGNLKSGFGFNAGAGITYSVKNLAVSIAVQNLVPMKRNNKSVLYTQKQNIRFYIGYNFMLGRTWSLKPQVLVDQALGAKLAFNAVLSVYYKNRVWLNVGYNSPNQISAGLGLLFAERFALQYTFKYGMGNIAKYSAGNHELCLGLALGKIKASKSSNSIFRKQSKSPYYEWE